MAIVGGLRARLIRESLYHMIDNALTALGWYDSGRPHEPIDFKSYPVDWNEEIALNTLSLADEDMTDREDELGSSLTENRWVFYVDFFGENDALALQLVRDIRDICGGRFPSIGRTGSTFTVYDYRQATPPALFSCDIEDIETDRARNFPQSWLKHWQTCRLTVIDHYADEDYD